MFKKIIPNDLNYPLIIDNKKCETNYSLIKYSKYNIEMMAKMDNYVKRVRNLQGSYYINNDNYETLIIINNDGLICAYIVFRTYEQNEHSASIIEGSSTDVNHGGKELNKILRYVMFFYAKESDIKLLLSNAESEITRHILKNNFGFNEIRDNNRLKEIYDLYEDYYDMEIRTDDNLFLEKMNIFHEKMKNCELRFQNKINEELITNLEQFGGNLYYLKYCKYKLKYIQKKENN